VGRTGSGKSSLMLTLFRLIDVNAESIYLDGVDTASIALDSLRRQLAIIPQARHCVHILCYKLCYFVM
jgi:ATP-binding cassette subfamily C (CFTR/MRP) protein 4